MEVRKIPRGTFALGGACAVALALPLLALALEAVGHAFHLGPADASRARLLTFAAIFAGLPMFLTGGGVARLVAHRLAENPAPRAARALATGAAAMGLGGVGIMV